MTSGNQAELQASSQGRMETVGGTRPPQNHHATCPPVGRGCSYSEEAALGEGWGQIHSLEPLKKHWVVGERKRIKRNGQMLHKQPSHPVAKTHASMQGTSKNKTTLTTLLSKHT